MTRWHNNPTSHQVHREQAHGLENVGTVSQKLHELKCDPVKSSLDISKQWKYAETIRRHDFHVAVTVPLDNP